MLFSVPLSISLLCFARCWLLSDGVIIICCCDACYNFILWLCFTLMLIFLFFVFFVPQQKQQQGIWCFSHISCLEMCWVQNRTRKNRKECVFYSLIGNTQKKRELLVSLSATSLIWYGWLAGDFNWLYVDCCY